MTKEEITRWARDKAARYYYSGHGLTGVVLDWIETGRLDAASDVYDDVIECAEWLVQLYYEIKPQQTP
jgi:hypothetical protein